MVNVYESLQKGQTSCFCLFIQVEKCPNLSSFPLDEKGKELGKDDMMKDDHAKKGQGHLL